jgi:hypothetical protein
METLEEAICVSREAVKVTPQDQVAPSPSNGKYEKRLTSGNQIVRGSDCMAVWLHNGMAMHQGAIKALLD